MVDVRAFRGYRFNPARVPDISKAVCPPYDVISPDEQEQLYERSPHNMVRLELGAEQPGDSELDNRYTRAAATLEQWRSEGALIHEERPALYLHRERFAFRGQQCERRDLIASVRLSDWSDGQVLPHERTMDRPKEDRFKLLRSTATQLSPVFALYCDTSDAVEQAWQWAERRAPEQRFVDEDGREHRVWVVNDDALIGAIGREFQPRTLYIADGHHRYETALHYRNLRRSQTDTPSTDDMPFEFVLMILTSAYDRGVVVLPTHRVVHGGPEYRQEDVDGLLAPHFHLERRPISPDAAESTITALVHDMERPGANQVMGMYGPDPRVFTTLRVRNEQALLDALPSDTSAAWRGLDVVVLHYLVVERLLGAVDTHEAIEYTRDEAHAARLVRAGQARLALFLKPTRVDQILAVAEAGERMPEKSTYFYPKPPTGLVLYPLT